MQQDSDLLSCLHLPDSWLILQGILSKYNVSDEDLEAVMKWKHAV